MTSSTLGSSRQWGISEGGSVKLLTCYIIVLTILVYFVGFLISEDISILGNKALFAQLETDDDTIGSPMLIPFISSIIQNEQEAANSIPGVFFNMWQTSPGSSNSWTSLQSLSGAIRSNTDPAVTVNSDGRLEAFVIGADNRLYHKWQNIAGSTTSWSQYASLGGNIALNTSPAVILNSDNGLEAFVIGGDKALHHRWQTSPGSSAWSAYESLGGGIDVNTSAVVGRNSDGRLEVFVVGTNNALFPKWQTIS